MNVKAICISVATLLLWTCSQPKETFTLSSDDPAYNLAELLAQKIPQLDPQLNTVLVKTNSFEITTNEIICQFQNLYGVNAPSLNNLDPDRILSEIENTARDLALEKLMLSRAEEQHISYDKVKRDSILNLHYQRTGSREAFLKELKDLQLSYDFIEKDIADGLIIDRLIEDVVYAQVRPPDDEDMRELYGTGSQEVVSFRHIALSIRDKSEKEISEAQQKIKKIHREALSGTSFEDLVRMHSEDESSKEAGGLYEDLEREMLEPIFEAAAFETPVGAISDIFETADGLNIIKIESRKVLTFDAYKQKEYEIELQRRKARAYQDYIRTLKEESEFRILGLRFTE